MRHSGPIGREQTSFLWLGGLLERRFDALNFRAAKGVVSRARRSRLILPLYAHFAESVGTRGKNRLYNKYQ